MIYEKKGENPKRKNRKPENEKLSTIFIASIICRSTFTSTSLFKNLRGKKSNFLKIAILTMSFHYH